MATKVKRRSHRSPLRREQAAATRARIVAAAAMVFARQGYGGTRIEDVAAEAGVAYPTVYKTFGNKRNLLTAAVSAAMTGGPEGDIDRQAWFQEQLEEPDAERQLRLIARNARRMYGRSGRLLEVVRATATAQPEIAGLWQEINEDRLDRAHTSARRLSRKAKLRVSVGEAARTLWATTVPELYVLQIDAGGLDPDGYEGWLGDLLIAALLQGPAKS